MKRTSTRLAAIGGIVVLGAFAIALAQHDARKREREQPPLKPIASQPATPIPVEDTDGGWGSQRSSPTKLVVRGNNDPLANDLQANKRSIDDLQRGEPRSAELPRGGNFALPDTAADNPLRAAGGSDAGERSQVIPASGGVPVEAPGGGSSGGRRPAWLGGTGASAGAGQEPELPKLPSFPMNTVGKPDSPTGAVPGTVVGSGANPLPSLASPMPAPPTTLSSNVGDMSDTQRGALPATEMSPLQSLPGTPFAGGSAIPSGGSPLPTAAAFPTDSPAAYSPPNMPTAPVGALPPSSSSQARLEYVPEDGSRGEARLPHNGAPASGGLPPNSAAERSAAADSPLPPARVPWPSNPNAGNPNTAAPNASDRNTGGSNAGLSAMNGPAAGSPSAGGNPPARTPAALVGLVSNQPGSRYLDGSQNPIMLIQKRAPEEIQVGKKATFVITVRNAGTATAHDVSVVDSVPRGVRFVESAPVATPTAQGILAWNLGEMAAGDERTITLQIVPEVQGEVGSVATVAFAAQASVRTVATLPKIELQVESAPEALIGSRMQVVVTLKNSGTGVARGVRLEADIPQLLKHDSGEAQLEANLGDLRPNELRRIPLEVTAIQPGDAAFALRATSDDGIDAEEQVAVSVLAPQLTAAIEGPRLRYLERQATYQIQVRNVGTAAASNLDFVLHLPAGLKYNSANNRATYDPAQHAVRWGLHELPPGEAAPMELTVLPVELGPQIMAFAASGDLNVKAEAKGQVVVDGLAELSFTIGQDNGTIEVGSSSTYSVQVTNVGNKADKDVRLVAQLPNGSKLVAVDAQVNYRTEGNQIIFEPLAEMRNRDQFTYRFQVQYDQPGTQVVRTQLTSANWPSPVIKEEGTLVYNDQN